MTCWWVGERVCVCSPRWEWRGKRVGREAERADKRRGGVGPFRGGGRQPGMPALVTPPSVLAMHQAWCTPWSGGARLGRGRRGIPPSHGPGAPRMASAAAPSLYGGEGCLAPLRARASTPRHAAHQVPLNSAPLQASARERAGGRWAGRVAGEGQHECRRPLCSAFFSPTLSRPVSAHLSPRAPPIPHNAPAPSAPRPHGRRGPGGRPGGRRAGRRPGVGRGTRRSAFLVEERG
jgi:hypothetical protein